MFEPNHHFDCSDNITDSHILSYFDPVDAFGHFHLDIEQDFVAVEHFLFAFTVALVDAELFYGFVGRGGGGGVHSELVYFADLTGTLHTFQMFVHADGVYFGVIGDWICFEQLLLLAFLLWDNIVRISY